MYLIDPLNIKALYWFDATDDLYIEQVSEIVESYIHNFCNIKTFEYANDHEFELYQDNEQLNIWVNNLTNVKTITSINWVVSTLIKWVDYDIKGKREILLKDKIERNAFGKIILELEAWYSDTTKEFKDIQKAANLLFELTHSNFKNWNNKYNVLDSISLWDISKGYNVNEMDSVIFESKKIVVLANTILSKYKLYNSFSN